MADSLINPHQFFLSKDVETIYEASIFLNYWKCITFYRLHFQGILTCCERCVTHMWVTDKFPQEPRHPDFINNSQEFLMVTKIFNNNNI